MWMRIVDTTVMATEVGPEEPMAKRRKLRKGTHSCYECRIRKVKCVFATPDDAICIMCGRRSTQCFSQCEFPQMDAVTGKIEHFKAKIDVDTSNIAEANNVDLMHVDKPITVALEAHSIPGSTSVSTSNVHSSAKGEQDHLHAIEHNYILSEAQTHADIRELLLRSLPCETDLKILSERISIISAICYQSDYKSHNTGVNRIPEQQIPAGNLFQPDRHPTLLARQVLLFAASIQHLSSQDIIPGLSKHQHIIMRGLAESAIKLVNTDDVFLGTLEGLGNLIFEMFYHIDSGNIRRAWVTNRRAVTAAQMLGLHRPGYYHFRMINDKNDLEPDVMWSTIISMERMLSLLLGLPTSTGHMILAFQSIKSDSNLGHNLSSLVSILAAKILERNQADSLQQALNMTAEIDQEIIVAAEKMPSEFWRPLAFVELEKDSLKALTETRRAFGHMCNYSLIVQLHLPHMLSPHDAAQRVYSKIACVNASREILTRQVELRICNPISACCRMSDFLSLIAGMTLMLGHITSHHGNQRDHLLVHQRLGDRATVERALGCIDSTSEVHGNVLATQCAALLRNLLAIEKDAAHRHNLLANQSCRTERSRTREHDILLMRVPYLGSIQISREGVVSSSNAKLEQAQSLAEGITVGGMGSMVVSRPHIDDFADLEDHKTARNAVQPLTPNSMAHDSSQDHLGVRNERPVTTDSPMQSDPMFPNVTADFDEWAFQGIDTAFMETLMRGSTALLSDAFGNESWDANTFP